MISAVIPVYNTAESELRQAVDSVRLLNPAEIILVDDHSNNKQTIAALQEQSECGCKVIVSQHVHSASGARATGIHAAKQPYILSVDSDDTISGTLPKQLAPINLARNNANHRQLKHPLDYLTYPQPILWGAIIKADLARYIATVFNDYDRQEDIACGYRLMLAAWRDSIPIQYTHLRYEWRSAEGRNSMTARMPQTKTEAEVIWNRRLEAELTDYPEAESLRIFANRKRSWSPCYECVQYDPAFRVDVHVLSYSEPYSSLKRTLTSLKSVPANVYVVLGGFPNSIGAARAFAFTLGNAEYVSFVDDDDLIEPAAFEKCLAALDADSSLVGVYTDTAHFHDEAGNVNVERKGRPWRPFRQLTYCPEITHLKIMRREPVMQHLDELAKWPTYEEYVLNALLVLHGDWQHLPIVGARKLFKPSPESSMRLASKALWAEALKLTTPILMRRHKIHATHCAASA